MAKKSNNPTVTLHDDGGMYPTESIHVHCLTHNTEALVKAIEESAADWDAWGDIDFQIQQALDLCAWVKRGKHPEKVLLDAAEAARCAIGLRKALTSGKDTKRAAVLALHLGATTEKILAQVDYDAHVRRDRARAKGKAESNENRKREAASKQKMVCDVWDEFTKADIEKRGVGVVRKEVGEIVAQRLNLPAAIPAETVRDYLKTRK